VGKRAPDAFDDDLDSDDPLAFESDDEDAAYDSYVERGRRDRSRAPRTTPSPGRTRPRHDPPRIAEDDELEYDDEAMPRQRDRKRVEVSEGFKCRHCRNFIGIPPSGGRNRNHCPLCLYSLHVDDKTPGDRGSDCRSLMRPIGVFYRPKGEQMVVHRCLGCGFVRYNRIAADDNPIVLAELPVLDPPGDGADWLPGA